VVFSSYASFITDAGDSGVLLPIALVSAAMLWFFHSHRLAWLLLRSLLATSVLIAALKVIFLACGTHWQAGLISPSGHACMSALVYGSVATVVAAGRPLAARVAAAAVVALLVGAIAISRVTLGVHSWIEVLVGLAVGLAGQLWFAWSYARLEPLRVDLKTFGVAVTATLLLAFGIRIPAESVIRHLAKRFGDSCEKIAEYRTEPRPDLPLRQAAAQPARRIAMTSSASARAD
jgi:membrane-associated phospholipid phosphatase